MAGVDRDLLATLQETVWPGPMVHDAARRDHAEVDAKPSKRRGPRQTVSVSLENSSLRIVVFTGPQVTHWATVDLNRGEDLDIPADIGEFLSGDGRHLCDLPFYAPLVRYFERPPVGRRFLKEVMATEIANALPFELDEVDLQWKSFQDGQGPEVVAAAVPHETLDEHITLLQAVGIRPSAAYAKASALALAAGHADAIVAHLTEGEGDLVLVRGGVPRAVHRIELPNAFRHEEYADLLVQAVREIGESDATLAPDGPTPQAAETPVVFTGLVPSGDR
ncbi:MAG: hypothetical protein WD645_04890, partial [Dehalococcoidia bacterium]